MRKLRVIACTFALAMCLMTTANGGEILTPGIVSPPPPPPPAGATTASGGEVEESGPVAFTLDQLFDETVALVTLLALSLR